MFGVLEQKGCHRGIVDHDNLITYSRATCGRVLGKASGIEDFSLYKARKFLPMKTIGVEEAMFLFQIEIIIIQ